MASATICMGSQALVIQLSARLWLLDNAGSCRVAWLMWKLHYQRQCIQTLQS